MDPTDRDDRPAVLLGLQAVCCDASTRQKLFELLERHFQPGTRKDRGREGMDLWRVLVPMVVTPCLSMEYDDLV